MSEEKKRAKIERLERENAVLRSTNARLMRERIGSSNSAAAARLAGAQGQAQRRTRRSVSLRAPLARGRLALRRALLRLLR